MRKLLARVVLRSTLAISAVGLVAAAGALSGSPATGPGAVPDRPAALIAPLASAMPAEPAGQAAQSTAAQAAQAAQTAQAGRPASYTLHTENGPRAALAARIVTATLLLTGLVLTGLGAIGMRGPSLHRRPEAVEPAPPPGCAPAYPPHPGSHPRFGPPPT